MTEVRVRDSDRVACASNIICRIGDDKPICCRKVVSNARAAGSLSSRSRAN